VDPKVKEWESSFLCFAGNPILYSDVKGDEPSDPIYVRGKSGDNLGGTRFLYDDVMSKYFSTGLVHPPYIAQALNFAIATGGTIEGTDWKGVATNNPLNFKNGSDVIVKLPTSSEIITGTIKTLKDVYKIDDSQLNKIVESIPYTFSSGKDYSDLFFYKLETQKLNNVAIPLPVSVSAPVAIPILPPINTKVGSSQSSLVVVTNVLSTESAANIAQAYNLFKKIKASFGTTGSAEHVTSKSKRTLNKHQGGQARGARDRGGAKGMKNPPRVKPKGFKGKWNGNGG
jgi:hypothetical protein